MTAASPELFDGLVQQLDGMRRRRLPWWHHWRELADYILPRRYVWLLTKQEASRPDQRNRYILDPTGTFAARTLASGMMNGITSPARPWFRLRIAGFPDDASDPARVWLDEVQRRMLLVMAESNFYQAMAVLYLDLAVFGTAAMTIYEDFSDVIRCYSHALGEYYVSQDDTCRVTRFAREVSQTVHQVDKWFGKDNLSAHARNCLARGGASLYEDIGLAHFIEPNTDKIPQLSSSFAFREFYWERAGQDKKFLRVAGFHEFPTIVTRWELLANEDYGTGPGTDCLPDIIQLQHETKKKGQALDKLVDPPVIADVQLMNQPTALLPRGITYIQGVNNIGVKPIHTIDGLPLSELTSDIAQVQDRIKRGFHNDLFRMISELDTVRSATEIDARREEKLVLLGPVLDRFESEALDPAITRIYRICERKRLLPSPPPELDGQEIEIQYVSVLSDAQRAVATIPLERFAQFTGNLGAIQPEVLDVPNWEEMTRVYSEALGVPAKVINSRDATAEKRKAREELLSAQQSANIGESLTKSAKQLSDVQVGGGAAALQGLLG